MRAEIACSELTGFNQSSMLEQFHAKPVEIYSNHEDRKSQGHQEAVVSAIEEHNSRDKVDNSNVISEICK